MFDRLKDLTFPQVALVAVLLAAIIVAHVVAPPAVSAVTSIVSMLTGAFAINVQQPPKAPALAAVPDKDGGA